jgi:hypothetical protein
LAVSFIEPRKSLKIKLDDMDTFTDFTWGDPVDHSQREIREDPIFNPFVVIVDTREQAPWQFQNFRADSDKKYRPLVIHTDRRGLKSGDYSIDGHENAIAIERKSLADAFSTFTVGRERFERELERLSAMSFAAVIIEGTWTDILVGPQRESKSVDHSLVIGKTVHRSILAWSMRFPRIHWWPVGGRDMAESMCFRTLERYWLDWQWRQKESRKAAAR